MSSRKDLLYQGAVWCGDCEGSLSLGKCDRCDSPVFRGIAHAIFGIDWAEGEPPEAPRNPLERLLVTCRELPERLRNYAKLLDDAEGNPLRDMADDVDEAFEALGPLRRDQSGGEEGRSDDE